MEIYSGFSNLNAGDLRTSTPRMQGLESRSPIFRSQQMGISTDLSLQQFSGKHGGLYLYVGRLLRPFWNLRCIKQETVNSKCQVKNICYFYLRTNYFI